MADVFDISGDFTKINIAPGDMGGQFDSNNNTPDGAAVYTSDDNQAQTWVVRLPLSSFETGSTTADVWPYG